jgi:signal transduction histidine kinase
VFLRWGSALRWFWWWLSWCLSAFAWAGPHAPALHLVKADLAQQPLAGGARPPLVLQPSELPTRWQPVSLPHAQRHDIVGQASQALAGPDGWVITWYRIAVPPQAGGVQPLWLYGARSKAYGPVAVYADGRLIGQWQLDKVLWYWSPFWLPLQEAGGSAAPRELLVRMAHPAHTRTALASLWLGPADAIQWRHMGRELLQKTIPQMGGGAFLAVGLFAFFVWLRGARDLVFLLFSVLGVASFIRGLHYFAELPVDNAWLAWLTVNALFWLITVVHHLQLRLHQVDTPRFNLLLHAIVVLVGVLTLPWVGRIPSTPDFTPLIYVLAMLTSPLVAAVGVKLSWRRSADGMLIAISVVLGTCFGMNDWALQSNLLGPEDWYLGPYANIVNFGVFAMLTFRQYMQADRAVRGANEVLAQRLSAKEAELHSSYERLREVERMQTLVDERQRLTQDMHDGLGSSLHTALRAVQRGQAAPDAVADILRGCIDDLYLAIDSMAPDQTDLLLLLGTLRHRLTPRLQQAGVTLDWAVSDVPPLPWLDARKALHIMRILQEALSNSLRHAGATHLRLSTSLEGDGVCVCLSDNGQGFDVQRALQQGGRGMLHQQRRAEAIGGRIAWHSEGPGASTRLWLPLIPVKVDA